MRSVRLLLVLAAGAVHASAPTSFDRNHELVAAYDGWMKLRNARENAGSTLDAREVLAWSKVKEAWRRFERAQDDEYCLRDRCRAR